MTYRAFTLRRGTPLTLNGPVTSSTPCGRCLSSTTRLPRKRPARRMRMAPGTRVGRGAPGRIDLRTCACQLADSVRAVQQAGRALGRWSTRGEGRTCLSSRGFLCPLSSLARATKPAQYHLSRSLHRTRNHQPCAAGPRPRPGTTSWPSASGAGSRGRPCRTSSWSAASPRG